jgi:Uma2 family endonuclease
MTIDMRRMRVEEFDVLLMTAEYIEHDYEFIAGEVIDVVAHPKSSKLGGRFLRYIGGFVDDNELGHATGADGGYHVENERYIPDVGYISFERQPELESVGGYLPNPPNLAVEVVSPSDSERLLMVKVGNYLNAGTVVWVVYPEVEEVAVYQMGQSVRVYTKEESIYGGDFLVGFSLDLKQIFK